MDQETENIVLSADSTTQVLREIDATLEGLELLSRTEANETQFYDQLLGLAAGPINAEAGAVFQSSPMGKLSCLTSLNPDFLAAETFRAEEQRLASLRANSLRMVTHDRGSHFAISTIVSLGDEVRRILVFYVDPTLPDASHAGYLQYVAAVAEVAEQFEKESDRRRLMTVAAELKSFERLALAVHGTWDLPSTCYAIANEGRSYLNCDRLSVAVRIGRRFETSAVSGVDVVDRTSRLVNTLETLIEAVAQVDETLIYDGDESRLPPQITRPLREYVDVSAAKSVIIVPIKRSVSGEEESHPFVALVAESLGKMPNGAFLNKLSSLSEQTALAVGRAVQLRRAPIARVLLAAGSFRRRMGVPASRWTVALLCCAAVVAALWFLPASFFVTVRGEVQPASIKGVFATADGVVEAVHVREGTAVSQGQVVASLASQELDLELQRVSGNLATAMEKLQAIDAERLQSRSGSLGTGRETSRLSASELTLKSQIESLQKQLHILHQQKSDLDLTSPIAGEVLTADVERLLAQPLRRGHRLMQVADLNGAWKLKFEVPDRRSGHVLRALQEQPNGLAIRFVLANRPERKYLGRTRSVAHNTQVDAGGAPVLPLEGTFERGKVGQLRPGASVVGKIDCGKRSLGFVWFHEIQEEFRRRFF